MSSGQYRCSLGIGMQVPPSSYGFAPSTEPRWVLRLLCSQRTEGHGDCPSTPAYVRHWSCPCLVYCLLRSFHWLGRPALKQPLGSPGRVLWWDWEVGRHGCGVACLLVSSRGEMATMFLERWPQCSVLGIPATLLTGSTLLTVACSAQTLCRGVGFCGQGAC